MNVMVQDSNAGPVDAERPAPKLLLDTNVYLDLADGYLPAEGERLRKIAAHRDPPLLWDCQITSDELIVRLCEGDQRDFLRYRAALRWMDDLCGVFGMAEPLRWVVRRGVFASPGPRDGDLAQILVRVRRALLRPETDDRVDPKIREDIDVLRAHNREQIDAWVSGRTELSEAVRQGLLKPGQRGVRDTVLAANAVLVVLRRQVDGDIALWGPQRDEADQRRAQRELIAFEVSLLRKSQNRGGYNHAKWRGDYHDYWLCAYPAATTQS